MMMETVYVIKSPDGYLWSIYPNRTYRFEPDTKGAILIPTKLAADALRNKYFKYQLSIRVAQLSVSKEVRDAAKESWRPL